MSQNPLDAERSFTTACSSSPVSHEQLSHSSSTITGIVSSCVSLSLFLSHTHTHTHKHPTLPLCSCLRVAACLFPLLFCPPLERDWKVHTADRPPPRHVRVLDLLPRIWTVFTTTQLGARDFLLTQPNNDDVTNR